MAASITHYTLPLPSFDKPVKLLIVVAPYYKDIADNLIAGARATAAKCGAEVDLVEVPGAPKAPPGGDKGCCAKGCHSSSNRKRGAKKFEPAQ